MNNTAFPTRTDNLNEKPSLRTMLIEYVLQSNHRISNQKAINDPQERTSLFQLTPVNMAAATSVAQITPRERTTFDLSIFKGLHVNILHLNIVLYYSDS